MWISKATTLIRGRRLFQCGYPKVRRILEGGAYFNADTQRYDVYYRATLIEDPALIRGNAVSQEVKAIRQ